MTLKIQKLSKDEQEEIQQLHQKTSKEENEAKSNEKLKKECHELEGTVEKDKINDKIMEEKK